MSEKAVILRQANKFTEAHFNYTSLEINVLTLVIKTLNEQAKNNDFYQFHFKISEITSRIGESNNNVTQIKKAVRALQQKIFEFELDGSWTSVQLIGGVRIDQAGRIYFNIDPFIKPMLFALSSSYTTYELSSLFALRSKYAKRIYIMANQFKDTGVWFVTVEDLKKRLGCENLYSTFTNFDRRVMKKAVEEINTESDLHLEIEGRLKEGREVSGYQVSVGIKDGGHRMKMNPQTVQRLIKYGMSDWQVHQIFLALPLEEINKVLYEVSLKISNHQIKATPGAYLAGIFKNKGVKFKTDSSRSQAV